MRQARDTLPHCVVFNPVGTNGVWRLSRANVRSFGVLVFEMLTGRFPFESALGGGDDDEGGGDDGDDDESKFDVGGVVRHSDAVVFDEDVFGDAASQGAGSAADLIRSVRRYPLVFGTLCVACWWAPCSVLTCPKLDAAQHGCSVGRDRLM